MSLATFLALLMFSLVSSITPGPNNIMLFASGVNFGFRRTIPHALGISFGFAVLLAAVGIGLGVLLEQFPVLFLMIKIAGGLYMVYLAWRIARSGPVEDPEGDSRPMTFLEASLFQWVNPKIWAVATSASVMVADLSPVTQAVTLAMTFSGINLGVCLFWTYAGSLLTTLLSDTQKWRIFMRIMAVALAVFSVLVFL